VRLSHLPDYSFEFGGRETLTRFLGRNLVSEFNILSPIEQGRARSGFGWAGMSALARTG
jgi:hypothetical protein